MRTRYRIERRALLTGGTAFVLSAVAGAVLLGLLSLSIGRLSTDASCCAAPTRAAAVTGPAQPPVPAEPMADDPLAVDQVARLGGELFGRHLLAVAVAGVLLLAALIGAIAVVTRGEAALEQDRRLAAGGSNR